MVYQTYASHSGSIEVKEFTTKNNLIPKEQFSFRDKHSTVHAISKLITDIFNEINNKQSRSMSHWY